MFEQSSRQLKITLLVLFIIALFGVVFVILSQRGVISGETLIPGTATTPSAYPTAPGTGVSSSPAVPSTLPPTLSMEEAQQQINAIQEQVNAGTLSLDDAKRQMNMISARVAPPALPADAKK